MCHLGVNPLITVYHFSLLDESKLLTRKDVYYQFCSEIYGLQEQMGDTDFFENQWTFGYRI